jgi:hypothetical protein
MSWPSCHGCSPLPKLNKSHSRISHLRAHLHGLPTGLPCGTMLLSRTPCRDNGSKNCDNGARAHQHDGLGTRMPANPAELPHKHRNGDAPRRRPQRRAPRGWPAGQKMEERRRSRLDWRPAALRSSALISETSPHPGLNRCRERNCPIAKALRLPRACFCIGPAVTDGHVLGSVRPQFAVSPAPPTWLSARRTRTADTTAPS